MSESSFKSQNDIDIKPQRKSITQSKKNYQFLWQSIFVFVSIVSAILLNKIYLYQTSQYTVDIRKGNIWQLFMFGTPFGILFILLQNLVHKKFDDKCQKYIINHQKYTTQQSRKKRSYTLVKWANSVIYYSISSASAYILLQQTSFMPTWLGGEGYCSDVSRYINSLDEATFGMKVFYIIQFGKHLGRFVHHVFFRAEGNFYEFALHHGLSTFLIFFSYLMNMWMIGIFVLLIHDISDIALTACRGYRDYRKVNRKLLTIMDILGGSLWVFCRIFLLSYCCVYSSFHSFYQYIVYPQKFNPNIKEFFLLPGGFMAFMLFALQILQVFWTYYIICSIFVTRKQKKATNTYQ